MSYGTGLIERDYGECPSGYLACAPSAPDDWLIPEAEWAERLAEQKAQRSNLLAWREANYDVLKSLNQSTHPLCWAFSTTKSVMYLNATSNEPPIVLSPWYVAGKATGWTNRGWWGSRSLQQIADTGVPPMADCPDFSPRYDTPAVAAIAAKRKAIEWWDGSENRDRNRTIMVTAFLLGFAPVLDLNWLGHSMCGCYLESINPLIVYADNSWGATDSYGPKGLYKLVGNQAIPDGVVVPRVINPSE